MYYAYNSSFLVQNAGLDNYYFQVTTAAVEQYTGEGEPPYCEMTLRADAMSDGSTPPDLTLPVTLTGVKQPTTITLERVAQQSISDILFGSFEQETGMQFAISDNIYNSCIGCDDIEVTDMTRACVCLR